MMTSTLEAYWNGQADVTEGGVYKPYAIQVSNALTEQLAEADAHMTLCHVRLILKAVA